MGRPKGSKNKGEKKQSNVEDTFETWIEYTCPVRGKVREKVKVKKLKPSQTEYPHIVNSSEDVIDKVEESDDSELSEQDE